MNSHWVEFMPKGHVHLKNVMFAPLVLEGKAVGLVGLANKPGDFDDVDAEIAAGFGELAAIALQNSRNLDEKNRIAQQREELIQELRTALDNVKTLSGLLPVCSICKSVRDDKGLLEAGGIIYRESLRCPDHPWPLPGLLEGALPRGI